MKKSGFTLAEVLITLGIVGVVSSLTIPQLNSNTVATKNRATLKKTIATWSNVARMNQVKNDWNFANRTASCSANENIARLEKADEKFSVCAMLNEGFEGERYMGATSTTASAMSFNTYGLSNDEYVNVTTGSFANYVTYQLADGVILGFNNSTDECNEENYFWNSACRGFIDVNGIQGPNRVVGCESASATAFLTAANVDTYGSVCTVDKNANADIFPVAFYNGNVVPATNAVFQYINAK